MGAVRGRKGSCAVLSACLAALMTIGTAPAEAARKARSSFDAAGAAQAARRIETDAAIATVFAACPADVAAKRKLPGGPRTGFNEVREHGCDRRIASCLKACIEGHNGDSCFSLARSFQLHPKGIDPLVAERLFSMACANGMAAGCTNRGAGIRNGGFDGDPFAGKPKGEQTSCQFRSFTLACEAGDSWGCAMLGQAYRLGEGTEKSTIESRRAYGRACELAPNFAACDFARDGIRNLSTPIAYP